MRKVLKRSILMMFLVFLSLNISAAGAPFESGTFLPNGEYISSSELRIRQLLTKISTVNLINALYLSRAQVEEIIKLGRSFNQAHIDLKNSNKFPQTLSTAEETFKALLTEIQKGEPARFEIPEKARKINDQLKEFKDRYHRELANLYLHADQQLRSILSEEQQQVIATFKPCLTPPKDLKSPIRAGQVSSNNNLVKSLKKLRKISDQDWKKRKGEILKVQVQKLYKRIRLTAQEEQQEIDRVAELVEKSRRLTDAEFELEKEKIAAEILPEDMLDQLKEELEFRNKHVQRPQKTELVQFILTEHTPEILKERLDNGNYLTKTAK